MTNKAEVATRVKILLVAELTVASPKNDVEQAAQEALTRFYDEHEDWNINLRRATATEVREFNVQLPELIRPVVLPPDPQQFLVWTEAYRPFILGGDVNAPIGCLVDVPAKDIIKLDEQVTVLLIKGPNNIVRVAEATSGAFIGTSLEMVKEDLRQADKAVIRDQIASAIMRRADHVQVIPEAAFWRLVRD